MGLRVHRLRWTLMLASVVSRHAHQAARYREIHPGKGTIKALMMARRPVFDQQRGPEEAEF